MSDINDLVSNILKQVNNSDTATTNSASTTQASTSNEKTSTSSTSSNGKQYGVKDYPLYQKHRDIIKTPSGKNKLLIKKQRLFGKNLFIRGRKS